MLLFVVMVSPVFAQEAVDSTSSPEATTSEDEVVDEQLPKLLKNNPTVKAALKKRMPYIKVLHEAAKETGVHWSTLEQLVECCGSKSVSKCVRPSFARRSRTLRRKNMEKVLKTILIISDDFEEDYFQEIFKSQIEPGDIFYHPESNWMTFKMHLTESFDFEPEGLDLQNWSETVDRAQKEKVVEELGQIFESSGVTWILCSCHCNCRVWIARIYSLTNCFQYWR